MDPVDGFPKSVYRAGERMGASVIFTPLSVIVLGLAMALDLYGASAGLPISASLDVRLEDTTPDSLLEYLNALSGLLSTSAAVGAALVGLGLYNRRRDQLQALEAQLNAFHRPMLQSLKASEDLHAALVMHRDKEFRVIVALLENRRQFSETEQMVIREIVAVGRRIETLVDERSGALEDETLRAPLGELVRHIRMFRWVAEECKRGDKKLIGAFVYPRNVNTQIRNEYERLSAKLSEVRAKIW